MFAQNVGIDVAGKDYRVCFKQRRKDGSIRIKGSRKFTNTSKGHQELATWIEKKRLSDQPVRVCMEATGVYYESLAYHLHDQGYQVHVLLPNRIKGYFKFLNLKSKTDKIEADGLAELGINHELPVWAPASPQMYALKGLNRERNRLIDQKTVFANQLHAQLACQSPNRGTVKRLKQVLRLLDRQVKEVEQDMGKKMASDPELKSRIDNICLVKGLGWITVLGIIAETNGFAMVQHKSQLVSYAGYDVIERQSGRTVKGKTRISKKGNRQIRRALHFPAMSAVRHQQGEFKNLYDRVFDRTKIKMKGYVAVQRKLLVLIYTLYKNNIPYDPDFAKQNTTGLPESRQGTMPAYTG